MQKYAAGVVLYNPQVVRLKSNLNAISSQVETVYCYNNNSNNIEEIEKLIKKYDNVKLINSTSNVGIAKALNELCNYAIRDGYSWILTLDQDSVCQENMVCEFDKYTDYDRIGIICPNHIDRRRPNILKEKKGVQEIDYCITSGSFVNLKVYQNLNGFDDYLFIDCVDNDYCFRVRREGYKIICLYNVVLDHEMGDLRKSRFNKLYLKIGKVLSSSKITSLSFKRKVSPMRVYYSTRNIVYLSRKYDTPFYTFSVKFAIYNGLSDIFRGENKLKITQAFIRGFIDGLNKEITEI